MLWLALVFGVIAILLKLFGANAAGGTALVIAKWCLIIAVVLFVLSLLGSVLSPGPYWAPGWRH